SPALSSPPTSCSSPLLSFYSSPPHRDLHSFPTRRSSDLDVPLRRPPCAPHGDPLRDDRHGRRVGRRPQLLTSQQIRPALARGRRSEEHTSELQSLAYLVCRLLLEKKKKI